MTIEFSISIPASLTTQAQIIEATNAWLSLLHTGATNDKQAEVFLANYAELTWGNRDVFPPNPGTEVDPRVTTWGVKMLPGAGAFYFANYDDDTHTLAHLPNTAPQVND